MKSSAIFSGLLVIATATCCAAQQSTQSTQSAPSQSLPSAPSAVAYPQPKPAQPTTSQSGQQGARPASPATGQTSNAAANTSHNNSAQSGDTTLLPPTDAEVEAEVARAKKEAAAKAAIESKSGAAASSAASTGAAGDDAEETIRKKVQEVDVIFTVTDKHGHFIRDLKRDDLTVLEDKQVMKDIRSFSTQTDLPLRVGLLIDVSSSIRDRFKFEQEAAIEFFSSIIRPRSDKAFVLGFDSTAEVTQDFTNDTEALARGVRMLKPAGGTALFDALYYACKDKLMKEQSTGPVRKAIILVSDGDDNQSRVTREEAIEMAQRAEVIVYAISTNLSPNKDRGDRTMERIADATGGRSFFPFKIQDVSDAFSNIQEELRSQYALAYRPPTMAADGRYHSIDINANDKKFHVRSRKGYFAPKS